MNFPRIRPRTAVFLLALFAFVYLIVETVSLYSLILFFNVLLIFINSVFLFAYFERKDLKPPALKEWPYVSIVIPNYNGASSIADCVAHVKAMSYPGKKEIIVVDDGSSDSSVKILSGIKGIRLIAKKKNAGKAAALNTGIAAAKGEAVATIDSDTYPEADCLEKMVPLLGKGVGAVTGFVRVHNNSGFIEKVQEVEYFVSFGFFQSILSDINALLVTPGPMSVYKKSALAEIGGFDEKNITEDMEIAFRLRKFGYKMVTSLEAHIYTEVPSTLKQLFRQRVRWYRGKFYNTIKYANMLFNPRFGEFGMFQFPFSVIVEWCIVLFVFVFLAGNIGAIFSYLGFAAVYLSNNLDVLAVVPNVFGVNSSFVFYAIGGIFYAIFIYFSHVLAGEKIGVSRIPELALFLMVYGIFILIVFFVGFFKEINKSDLTW